MKNPSLRELREDRTAAVDTIGARTGFRFAGVGPVVSLARTSIGGVSEDLAMVGIDSRHEVRDVVLRAELLSNVRRFGQDYRVGAGIDLEIGSGLTLNGALAHDRVGPSQTNALSAGVTWRAFDALDLRAALGVSRSSGGIDGRSISVGTAFRF